MILYPYFPKTCVKLRGLCAAVMYNILFGGFFFFFYVARLQILIVWGDIVYLQNGKSTQSSRQRFMVKCSFNFFKNIIQR